MIKLARLAGYILISLLAGFIFHRLLPAAMAQNFGECLAECHLLGCGAGYCENNSGPCLDQGYVCCSSCPPSPTPTTIPVADPTKTPAPGATNTPTPTSASAPTATVAPTSSSCVPEPSHTDSGSCTSTPQCANSTSPKECVNATCRYYSPLKACPDGASCATHWVPGGWSCTGVSNNITAPRINLNPNSQTDNDRFDVFIDGIQVTTNHIPTSYGQNCTSNVHIEIGPDTGNLHAAKKLPTVNDTCTFIQGTNTPTCTSNGYNDNIGAQNERNWTYSGGQICARASLVWRVQNLSGGWEGCGTTSDEAQATTCYTPPTATPPAAIDRGTDTMVS